MTLYEYRGCIVRGDSHKMEDNNKLIIYQKDEKVAEIRNIEIETRYSDCFGKKVKYFTVKDL